MVLGDLLARFGDESTAAETVLSLADVRLVAALRQCADAEGLGLGAFASLAVRRYEAEASAEEWVTLMGELARSADPGLAFIKRALSHATGAPV
ncbi:MAG TPA: hypothetical protein VGA46_08805 [Methyloceanibacter sp.]|jgi:hypothetical protein